MVLTPEKKNLQPISCTYLNGRINFVQRQSTHLKKFKYLQEKIYRKWDRKKFEVAYIINLNKNVEN